MPAGAAAVEMLRRLRVPVLLMAGMVVAHDAIFASDDGVVALGSALARSGHGPAWTAVTVAALVAGSLVAVAAVARLWRIAAELRTLSSAFSLDDVAVPSQIGYAVELRRLWTRLFPGVLIGFVVQENIEALVAHGQGGIFDLVLTTHPLAVPVVALLTLAMAAAGALLRQRTRALEQLVSALRARRVPLPRPATEPNRPDSAPEGLRLGDSIRLRPQAGRAPPSLTRTVSA